MPKAKMLNAFDLEIEFILLKVFGKQKKIVYIVEMKQPLGISVYHMISLFI